MSLDQVEWKAFKNCSFLVTGAPVSMYQFDSIWIVWIVFTVTQQNHKSKAIQCIKLRNWDVIEDKEIRHLSKF